MPKAMAASTMNRRMMMIAMTSFSLTIVADDGGLPSRSTEEEVEAINVRVPRLRKERIVSTLFVLKTAGKYVCGLPSISRRASAWSNGRCGVVAEKQGIKDEFVASVRL
ncbi:hypothetical protein F4808DRAFT_344633 [Astrocystis sublimbata]|nr:hypothetical protein F4808DRAFT_344633 [Astrocystis sublimbata]